ncbi:hypothetical protein PIB30_000428 [Stylosanthes scabra]|uniref:DRBM domain-containing protein n=1 Tax=Stylosanthes scabra TaxID=79078 RepID=A0ABU6V157_9FABA|nr:hypothetical protein [Stylosanthes scabra]
MSDQPVTAAERATCRHVKELISQTRAAANEDPPQLVAGAADDEWDPANPAGLERHMERLLHFQPEIEFVPQRDWSKVAVWRSRQVMLRNLCDELGYPPPSYRVQAIETRSRGAVQRFFAMVPPSEVTRGLVTEEKYSTDEHLAREDAAAALMKRILHLTGKHVDDFNYDEIDPTLSQNYDLSWELGYVKGSFKAMHAEVRCLKRIINPDLLGSSSDSDDDP